MTQGRQTLHRSGFEALKRGDYAEAVKILENCVRVHGPHVAPLTDLALAAYLKEDMGRFGQAVEQLEKAVAEAEPALSAENRVRAHVALAKCFELQGRIAEAFDRIENALELLPSGTPYALHVRCQKLRLLASFGRENEISKLYGQCAAVSEESAEALIESFHALLLAETRLLGLRHAWPRLLHLSRSSALHAADLKLCAFDLLEVAIESRDFESQRQIFEFIDKQGLQDFDTFESALRKMALEPDAPLTEEEIFGWTLRIPASGIVRLLALELQRRPKEVPREIQKQLVFRLQALDARTRKLLYRKWAAVVGSGDEIHLEIDLSNRSVHGPPGTLLLTRSPHSWAILLALAEKREIRPADFLAKLSKTGGSQDFDSLRVHVARMNRKLVSFLHVDWVVRFSKERVQLNPSVHLQIRQGPAKAGP